MTLSNSPVARGQLLQAFRKAVTCMFGRDGRIRTGGLLLPKQAR